MRRGVVSLSADEPRDRVQTIRDGANTALAPHEAFVDRDHDREKEEQEDERSARSGSRCHDVDFRRRFLGESVIGRVERIPRSEIRHGGGHL